MRDYNEMLIKMSLEPSVIDQHNNYVKDRKNITNTASFLPTRSDSQTNCSLDWIKTSSIYGKWKRFS